MNEKIRELAEQAKIHFSRVGILDGDPNGMAKLVSYSKMEKFAELIVRECMTICKEHPSRIVSNNWVADAVAPDIVSQFEEHFGVEE